MMDIRQLMVEVWSRTAFRFGVLFFAGLAWMHLVADAVGMKHPFMFWPFLSGIAFIGVPYMAYVLWKGRRVSTD